MLPRTFPPLAPLALAAISLAFPASLAAQASPFAPSGSAQSGQELPPYLQCVPYAREVSGIEIFGDAHTWWDQAAGRYERGIKPRVGAVMSFMPYRRMELGHVATVARIVDSRTVLLDHANWSPIDGRRGQIERGVKAVDVSPKNDWSQVRVWYDPLQKLGTTAWPVRGFIYPDGSAKPRPQQRIAQAAPQRAAPQPARAQPSRSFLAAFSGTPQARPAYAAPQQRSAAPQLSYASLSQPQNAQARQPAGDVAARAVALYD